MMEKNKDKMNKLSKSVAKTTKKVTDITKEKISTIPLKDVKNSIQNNAKKMTSNVIRTTTNSYTSLQNQVNEKLDVNNDGVIDITDIIILSMNVKGVNINRASFLEKEFSRYVDKETIQLAIETTPMNAKISDEIISKIADNVIQYERNCVTGISTALGTPGGATMVATVPADIIQYYGYMLRTAQKLMYLYGYPQLDYKSTESSLDTENINILILCLGTMYAVAGANNAIKLMAVSLAKGVSKKFMQASVTKGVVYPIIKKTISWFGIKLTKKACTNFFSKAIPLIGGVIGGTITYTTFKPCCVRLKETLSNTILSNKNYLLTNEEKELVKNL